MRESYRRRFVISIMVLVGAVLLAVFISFGVMQARSVSRELRITMFQVLEQLDGPNEKFRPLEPREMNGRASEAPPEREGEKNDLKPAPPKKMPLSVDRNKIVTAFYNSETRKVSITKSLKSTDDSIVDAAVSELLTVEDSFGRLSFGLLYCKERADGGWKIALANESDLMLQLLRLFMLYAVGFLLSMGLLLLVSIWLSKLAARPMEHAMHMQRQFVDDVSHDLKTPITVILANNSIVKSNPHETVESQRQWLDATEEAAKDMMAMIHEMLSLSALESSELNVEIVPVDLTSAAQKAVLQMESVAFDRSITVEDDIAENVTGFATTEFADRICNSLLENALKYEPDGGRVRVTLQTVKKQAVFAVQNFGTVIPPEDLSHVFERFYRSDKVRASADGHGLGLPIVKQITTLIGASVTAESSEKEGTVFRVSFASGGTAAKNGQ